MTTTETDPCTSNPKFLKEPGGIVCSSRLDDPDLTGRKMFRVKQNIGADTHEVETYGKGPHRVRIEKRGDYAYVSILDA